MRKLFFSCLLLLLCSIGISAQTNPVAEFYPKGYPIWTDSIQWTNVINMKTNATILSVNGEWARYEKGVELLGAKGGVLYYPAGTYIFSDIPAGVDGAAPQGEGIMLRSGVVIMGEKPAAKQIASEVAGGAIELTTKFEFPLVDRLVQQEGPDSTVVKKVPSFWNFVGQKPRVGETLKDIKNIGVCFIQFKYGGLYWGAEYAWAASYSDATAQTYGNSSVFPKFGWMKTRVADGTHYNDPFGGCAKLTTPDAQAGTDYKGAGSGRLILACRFDEAVLMDAGGTYLTGQKNGLTNKTQNFSQLAIDSYRFAGRITVDAKNVFIASNAITKPVTLPFIYKAWLMLGTSPYATSMQNKAFKLPVLFDPAKQIGIDLGKSVIGLVNINQRTELKESAPLYEPNMIVRDNYVYNHGNKGIEVSGKWVKIINNVNDRAYLSNGLPATSATVATVGDAATIYGITTAIPYQIPTSTATPPTLADVVGVAGHYCARMSNWKATGTTDDNMARAFDMGGQNIWIDSNSYWGTGSLTGNDGEGILSQRAGGVEAISWAITNNKNLDKGTSKSGYIGLYDVNVVGALVLNNSGEASGYTAGVVKPVANYIAELAILNNTNKGTVSETSPKAASGNNPAGTNIHETIFMTNDYPGSPNILVPTGVKVNQPLNNEYNEISWNPDYTIGTDTVDLSQEIGYRVERRIVGENTWSVAAVRPMQTGKKPSKLSGAGRTLTYNGATTWTLAEFDPNPSVWRDYEKPANGSFEYRVVALGATESQNAVSDIAMGVSPKLTNQLVRIYPNPTTDKLYLSQLADNVTIVNLQGAVISSFQEVNQVSLNGLSKGIYLLKIQLNKQISWVKVIKK
ncbi:MAG: T9SS type A sorting domain-containing protein [Bacteroidales bacterium]